MLGASGFIVLPSAIVEPLIAASIVYVAIENLFTTRLHVWRLPVVFAFGLLHGLGFAGVLGEIGLPPDQFLASLLAFNLGVEAGQLSVVALAWLAVGWFRGNYKYHKWVAAPASLAIAAVAVFWVFDRTGLV
jgi:hypothetical protein